MSNPITTVKASTFADPADIRAYDKAIAAGCSQQEAFKVGDNGVGCWGDSTRAGTGPCCALPREDWAPLGKGAHNAKVRVSYKGHTVVALLKDTMPRRRDITNGCGLDMNPDLTEALGLPGPGTYKGVTWQFV